MDANKDESILQITCFKGRANHPITMKRLIKIYDIYEYINNN